MKHPSIPSSNEWSWSIFGFRFAELHIKSENFNNRSGFYVRFLNLSVWDMMAPDFSVIVKIGITGGCVKVLLPYLMIAIGLFPDLDPNQRTWRTCPWIKVEPVKRHDGAYDLIDSKTCKYIATFETISQAARWARKNYSGV